MAGPSTVDTIPITAKVEDYSELTKLGSDPQPTLSESDSTLNETQRHVPAGGDSEISLSEERPTVKSLTEQELDTVMRKWSAAVAIELKNHSRRRAPTKLGIILTWMFQILGLAVAILFGVFSVLSYQAASLGLALSQAAINITQVANQVALLSMCQQLNVGSTAEYTAPSAAAISNYLSFIRDWC